MKQEKIKIGKGKQAQILFFIFKFYFLNFCAGATQLKREKNKIGKGKQAQTLKNSFMYRAASGVCVFVCVCVCVCVCVYLAEEVWAHWLKEASPFS